MENKIRIAIIEDEAPARELIGHYLEEIDYVEIIAECADGFSGLKAISSLKPDLVILDIQMPRLTGIEMLEVTTEKPEVIFTTAYDQFAIKAFELNATDYLLNPFEKGGSLKRSEKLQIRSGQEQAIRRKPAKYWQKCPHRILQSTGLW